MVYDAEATYISAISGRARRCSGHLCNDRQARQGHRTELESVYFAYFTTAIRAGYCGGERVAETTNEEQGMPDAGGGDPRAQVDRLLVRH